MMEQGSVRNLEQIQENDGENRAPRFVSILLVALGAGCIVFAGLALGGKRTPSAPQKTDPLGDLVQNQGKPGMVAANGRPTDLSARDVTFPGILSDESSPTTALAAVKGGGPQQGQPPPALQPVPTVKLAAAPPPPAPPPPPAAAAEDAPTGAIALNVPPPATDRLPVVPLPAQNVLQASPVVTRPRDDLTKAASDAAQISTAAEPSAPAGHDGGYQLQVSSFRTQSEADGFAAQLRARGHKSYVVEAHVPGRGTWYRVRIGPFPSQHAAASYRAGFEGREHVVPFIVNPTAKEK